MRTRNFRPNEEAASLAKLRAAIAKAGFRYMSDPDSRAPGDAEPDGLLWDFGPDTLKAFDALLAVRRNALDHFSIGVLPPDRQAGEIEARLVPIYLLHRYQTEAVARLIGGADYAYSEAADRVAGTQVVPAADAARRARPAGRDARRRATRAARERARSRHAARQRLPAQSRILREQERAAVRCVRRGRSGGANTTQFLFAPQRLNRIAWQHARDKGEPGVADVLDAVFRGTWQRDRIADGVPAGAAVQTAADWVVLDTLLNALDAGQLHAQVDADVRASLIEWQKWLAKSAGEGSVAASRAEAASTIAKYLADPKSVKLRALPAIPPGAPI